MRILFLAHRLPYPPNKGDKIRSFWMLQNLATLGDVELFCFYDDERDTQYLPELKKFCSAAYVERISPFLARLRAGNALLTGRPFSLGYFYSPAMQRRVAEAIRQQNYDLIFVFCTAMAQYVPATHVPALLDMVDVDSDKGAQYWEERRSLMRPAWRLEAKRLSRFEQQTRGRFQSVLLCTDHEVKLLIGNNEDIGNKDNDRVVCIPNRFDLHYFDPAIVQVPNEIQRLRPFVAFTGQMDYFPNADAVQYFQREIWPHLLRARPDLKFVIVGRNPSPEVKRLRRHASITVTCEVPDVRPYLKAAEAAVFPLRIARGVQNKTLEALAMGAPVVASTRVCQALPDSVARFIQRAEGPIDFADATAIVMRRKQNPLGEIRKALAANYGSEALRRQICELVSSCVQGGTEPRGSPDLLTIRGRA